MLKPSLPRYTLQTMTLHDAIQSFLRYIRTERRLSAATVHDYTLILTHFADYLSQQWQIEDIAQVDATAIRDWQMSLAEAGLSAVTIRTRLVAVRSLFRHLRRQGIVETDVMARVVTPKLPKRLPIFYTEGETSQIYDAALFADTFEGHRDQLLLQLLYETGIRRGEAVGLTERSVDFSAKTLKVLGKRDKERIIPLENELLHNIKCYFSLKEQEVGKSDAFFVRNNGTPFKGYDVDRIVKRYMTPLSHADRISPHVFRHSFATHMLNEGADIGAIKELLGHTDLSATEVYTHVSRQRIQEVYRHAHPRQKND